MIDERKEVTLSPLKEVMEILLRFAACLQNSFPFEREAVAEGRQPSEMPRHVSSSAN